MLALFITVVINWAMPYTPEHAVRTRERILESAGRMLRRRGATGASVDAIMGEAGLTSGGFYAHFRKKDALVVDVIERGFKGLHAMLFASLEDVRGVPFLATIARRYLSRSHRDDLDDGCIAAALLGELPRLGREPRKTFERRMRDTASAIAPHMPATKALNAEDRALATLALFTGGIMLARAVEDRDLSDRILAACRRLAVPEAYAADVAARDER